MSRMLNALQRIACSTSGVSFPAKNVRPENRGETAIGNHQDNTIQPEKNENTLEVRKVCAQQVDCLFETTVSQEKMTSQTTVGPPTGAVLELVTELSDWPILLQSAIDAVPNHAKGIGRMVDLGLVEVRLDSGENGVPAPASNEVLIASSYAEVDVVLEEMDLSSFARREVVDFNMGQLLDAVPDGITQKLGPPGMKSDAVNTLYGVESSRAQCRNQSFDTNTTGTQEAMETSFSLQQAGRQQMVENGDETLLAGELLDLASFLPDHGMPLFEPPDLEGFETPLESHEVRQPILHDQVALEDHQTLAGNLPDVPETKLSAAESPPGEQSPHEFVVDVCPQKQASVLPFNSNRSPGERPVAQQPFFEIVVGNMGTANDRQQPNIEEEDLAESNRGIALSTNIAFEEGEVTGNQTVEPSGDCSPDAADTACLNGGTQKTECNPVVSRGEVQADSSAAKPRGTNDTPAIQQELSGAVLSQKSKENDGGEIPDGNAPTASTKVQETENPLPALKDAVAELLRFSIPLLAPASMSPAVNPAALHQEERRLAELSGTQVGQRYQELADHLYGSLPFKSGSSISFLGIESTADTTEVVTNAGLLLAQEPSERVLLIDGDFSDKRLTRQFLLQGSKGLAEVLNDERTCGDVVYPCETPNLSVVPAGTGLFPRQPSAVRRLPSIIDEFKQQFSIILFDAGGAEDSQVETLVRWTDTSYLVLPLGVHTVEELDGVISLLHRCAARMMGCILTNVTVETVS